MLVNAKPRQENGDAAYSVESFAESDEVESTDVLSSVDAMKRSELTNSFDLSGSISARNRRREKLPVIINIFLLNILISFCSLLNKVK